jgi:hypothetical protein
MKQTPMHDNFNGDLLALVPNNVSRIVEVGCSSGALCREYKNVNPNCRYVGLEIDPAYADVARRHCDIVVAGNIERMSDSEFERLTPCDCWIFGDVLEHLYDPWAVLRRIRACSAIGANVVACIPNAQHWSVQLRLNSGDFRYEDAGLLDRTHIRWFTRSAIGEMFDSTGFQIAESGVRVLDEQYRDAILEGIRAMAKAIGVDASVAASEAIPFQWLVRAIVA